MTRSMPFRPGAASPGPDNPGRRALLVGSGGAMAAVSLLGFPRWHAPRCQKPCRNTPPGRNRLR